jgi:UDP-N-acetylglucosamine 2-epimerase (non-hydrolysing)
VKLLAVVGARPNYVKMAPLVRALLETDGVAVDVANTGQHYDHVLAGSFIEQLAMPEPRYAFGVGSGSHAHQTAAVLTATEDVLAAERYDGVIVAGDVNSTMAAALAAAKLHVPIVHLESGLRSGDWTMPEEVNRVVTDRISDLLLSPSPDAVEHLRDEGIAADRIELVGNTMIDSLLAMLPGARATNAAQGLGLPEGGYVLVTLHRPALVDDPARLAATLEVLDEIAADLPVAFPVHPRTRSRITVPLSRVTLLDPVDYLTFLGLEASARLVVTDSGGIQEETSVLGIRCLTFRTTTERPITIEQGTNTLVPGDPADLLAAARDALAEPPAAPASIPLWDGQAGPRAAAAIVQRISR